MNSLDATVQVVNALINNYNEEYKKILFQNAMNNEQHLSSFLDSIAKIHSTFKQLENKNNR
ncbi:MAG TPA: hypothetical protein PKY81_10415 [bacterium]|nr:hypothetical protein [bacterium]HPN31360.1 hypothetical protein [bacterium]